MPCRHRRYPSRAGLPAPVNHGLPLPTELTHSFFAACCPPSKQTGAGKTYSLSSIAADAIGMIPRAAAEIFSHIEGDPSHEYTVYMSYVQLYMELIQVGALGPDVHATNRTGLAGGWARKAAQTCSALCLGCWD